MHIALAGVQLLVMVLFMSIGAVAGRRGFRFYSAATIVAMLASGALVSRKVAAIAAGEATPWMGAMERISVYTPMLWVVVLSVVFLKSQVRQDIRSN